MKDRYSNLRAAIYSNKSESDRFRALVVNCIMGTMELNFGLLRWTFKLELTRQFSTRLFPSATDIMGMSQKRPMRATANLDELCLQVPNKCRLTDQSMPCFCFSRQGLEGASSGTLGQSL